MFLSLRVLGLVVTGLEHGVKVTGEANPGSFGVADVESFGSKAGCICNGADTMSKSGSGHKEGNAYMSTSKLSTKLESELQMTYTQYTLI